MDTTNLLGSYIEIKRIRQALKVNPNDIDAQLRLAHLLGTVKKPDLELKRKVLNHILSLDATHKKARQMLLEMDRAEIHGGHSQPAAQETVFPTAPPVKEQLEKLLVSRYSIIHRILVYPFVAFSILFMIQAFGDWAAFLIFATGFLLLLIPTWFVSAVVTVSSLGIGLSRLFGFYRREVEWSEIEGIKPAVMGVGMILTTRDGTSLTISSQMSRYPFIVDVLQQLRPDLFTLPDVASFNGSGFSSGSKTFRKRFFAKYWLLFVSFTASLIFLVTLSIAEIVSTIILGIVLYFLWDAALHAVHTVNLDGNRVSTKSFRRKQEWTAQQIRDIRMVTRRNSRGVGTHLIQIVLLDNTDVALTGFPEGNEIMYGFLKSWWSAYQNI